MVFRDALPYRGCGLGLVHSVVSTADNVHVLNIAADRLYGEEKAVYGGSRHFGMRSARNSQTVRASSGSP